MGHVLPSQCQPRPQCLAAPSPRLLLAQRKLRPTGSALLPSQGLKRWKACFPVRDSPQGILCTDLSSPPGACSLSETLWRPRQLLPATAMTVQSSHHLPRSHAPLRGRPPTQCTHGQVAGTRSPCWHVAGCQEPLSSHQAGCPFDARQPHSIANQVRV